MAGRRRRARLRAAGPGVGGAATGRHREGCGGSGRPPAAPRSSSSSGLRGRGRRRGRLATVTFTTPGNGDVVLDDLDVLLADALDARSARRRSRRSSSAPASSSARAARAAQRVVGLGVAAERERLGFVTPVMPRIGRWITVSVPAARGAVGPRDARPAPERGDRERRPSAACAPRSLATVTLGRSRGRDERARLDRDVARRRRRAREDDLARRRRAASAARRPTSATSWSRSRPSAVVEEAGVVDQLELARDHRVLAGEALGERAQHAARVAVGEPRRRLRVGRPLVARVEVAAGVRAARACGRRARSRHTIVPAATTSKSVPVAEAGVGAVREPVHPHRRRRPPVAGASWNGACSARNAKRSRVDAAGERCSRGRRRRRRTARPAEASSSRPSPARTARRG